MSFIRKIRPFESENQKREIDGSYSYTLNLAEIQRYRMDELKGKLVKDIIDIEVGDKAGILDDKFEKNIQACSMFSQHKQHESAVINSSLVQALQDYDYMKKCRERSRDPFLFAGSFLDDRDMFEDAMRALRTKHPDHRLSCEEKQARVADFAWEMPQKTLFSFSSGASRGSEKNTAFVRRLMIAAFGAAFLIGPMWLMMKKTDLNTKLVSTTVFVTVFGLLMAYFIEEYKDVLSSTAAYAAVLVVFVG